MTALLPPLDLAAILWFTALVAVYEFLSMRPRFFDSSIAAAVQRQREAWMIEMSERDNRIMDSQLLGWLVSGNAFFASTTALTIGGLAALLGYGEKARQIFESFPLAAPTSSVLWEIKVIFLMSIMVFAFFKFAWAFRLSHYTVIMMGATPPPSYNREARISHARRVASLLGLVGEHSNRGMRSFYYTIAGLFWFFHPVAFIAATTGVLVILLRRDYWSMSRSILRGEAGGSARGV